MIGEEDAEDDYAFRAESAHLANSKHVLTHGTIGSNITLQAIGGIWFPIGTPNGVTIT